MKRAQALEILAGTIQTYDTISQHFSQTRNSPGSLLFKLGSTIRHDAVVLDVGCGNGRLVEALPTGIHYTGIDVSRRLLHTAREKYPEQKDKFQNFNGTKLSFEDNMFTDIFMLATLHHVPGVLRMDLLTECKRVLKKDGTIIITVWHLWRKPFMDQFVATLPKKMFNRSLDFFDMYIPWKDQNGKILGKRYFHMFYERELAGLLRRVGFMNVTTEVVTLQSQKNYLVKAYI